MKSSDSLFPDSLNNLLLATPDQIAEWNAERKRNYPTKANIERKKIERQRLKESGAYTTTAATNKRKVVYTEIAVNKPEKRSDKLKGKAPIAEIRFTPKKSSLFEKIVYQSARDHDSLILEALTYIRNNNWLQGLIPQELIDSLHLNIQRPIDDKQTGSDSKEEKEQNEQVLSEGKLSTDTGSINEELE